MSNNGHQLKQGGFRPNTGKYFLHVRTVEQSPALEIFKTRLDKAVSNLTSELALL